MVRGPILKPRKFVAMTSSRVHDPHAPADEAPQPQQALERVRAQLERPAPSERAAVAELDALATELDRYFQAKDQEEQSLRAALPFTAEQVTYRGESWLHRQYHLLQQLAALRSRVAAGAPTGNAAWWDQRLAELAALQAELTQYEAKINAAAPPPAPDTP